MFYFFTVLVSCRNVMVQISVRTSSENGFAGPQTILRPHLQLSLKNYLGPPKRHFRPWVRNKLFV